MPNRSNHSGIPANLRVLPLSAAFFITGFLWYALSSFMALSVLPELLGSGSIRSSHGWALAHMQLLGWGSMIAMGASLQLMQVILNTRIYSMALGWIHYAAYTIGLVLLIHGFMTGNAREILPGGAGVAAGVLIYACNMIITLIRKQTWNVFVLGMSCSLLNLLFTVGLGCMLGISMTKGWLSGAYPHLFSTHLWLGLGGWMTGLIFTFTFKLLPMFYISGHKPGKAAYVTLLSLFGGIWIQIAEVWLEINWLTYVSLACLSVSIIGLSLFVNKMKLSGRSKQPTGAVAVAVNLIPLLFVIVLLFIVPRMIELQMDYERLYASLIVTLVMGWFTPTILAYLSRIVPFLWWAYRFRTKEEKKNAVLLHDMLPNRRLTLELLIYLAAFMCVFGGIWAQAPGWIEAGLLGSFLAAGIYFYELSRVFRY